MDAMRGIILAHNARARFSPGRSTTQMDVLSRMGRTGRRNHSLHFFASSRGNWRHSIVKRTMSNKSEKLWISFSCWMYETKYTNVLIVPACAAMFMNLIFLCNIVRVLMTKLRAGPHVGAGSQRPSQAMLQAFRATLLLVPLLGLHYLLTPFRPQENHHWEFAYEVISAITAGLQGLCVATLFCFCNGEVKLHFI